MSSTMQVWIRVCLQWFPINKICCLRRRWARHFGTCRQHNLQACVTCFIGYTIYTDWSGTFFVRLFEAFDTHYIGVSHLRNPNKTEEYMWTMTTSLFFTTTLLTTIGWILDQKTFIEYWLYIGYGNLVPSTDVGKIFCIFYALFGVPLILITVADIGKFLSENMLWLYSVYRNCKFVTIFKFLCPYIYLKMCFQPRRSVVRRAWTMNVTGCASNSTKYAHIEPFLNY